MDIIKKILFTVFKFLIKILRKGRDQKIYREHIACKFKYLDFTGLKAILPKPLLLTDIYVKLRTSEHNQLKSMRTIADFEEQQNVYQKPGKDFLTVYNEARSEYRKKHESLKMLILGKPGSGKTTLMKWIALQCVSSNKGNKVFKGQLPVFVSLKSLGQSPNQTFKTMGIVELAIYLLKNENISSVFLRDQFEANKLIFLLDALDEVADETVRRDVIQWIEKQHIKNNVLIITSRFSGIYESKGLKFHNAVPVFEIQDFVQEDIEEFLKSWYTNTGLASVRDVGKDEKEIVLKHAMNNYENLKYVIDHYRYRNLRRIGANPLLLTIIAIVHQTRASLPEECHKLYHECLEVMIELWNTANRKLNIFFSVDKCLDNLSTLAVFMMSENRREMRFSEIQNILPSSIENYPLEFFLNEMVLKAGLLYYSESNYGFLHLTFQEYLAARFFANKADQNLILDYKDKDYWKETFKLFVNLGNTQLFFDEIINNLEEKEYWRNMNIWNDCLQSTACHETKRQYEIKFASKVLKILPEIGYEQGNEELIEHLGGHYPLYQRGVLFKNEAWNLFYNSKHQLAKSVGIAMLSWVDEENFKKLMNILKQRIDEFEKQKSENERHLLDFLYEERISFFIMLASTQRTSVEFLYVISKLKSQNLFLVYFALLSLQKLLAYRPFIPIQDIFFFGEFEEFESILKSLDLDPIGVVRNHQNLAVVGDLRYILDDYKSKYLSIIIENKAKIDTWVDKAKKIFQSLPADKKKYYFSVLNFGN